MIEIHLPGEFCHTWEGTLADLLKLIEDAGGSMNTHLLLCSDGEPLYFNAFVEDDFV
jgi:hypothetical protein